MKLSFLLLHHDLAVEYGRFLYQIDKGSEVCRRYSLAQHGIVQQSPVGPLPLCGLILITKLHRAKLLFNLQHLFALVHAL